MDSKNLSSSNIGDGNQGDYNQQATQSSQNPITAFLAKLWALVNDPSCDDLIAWDPSGGSFHVYDQSRFAREILPRYFKHNNFASFIRQLNMYGFRKMSTIEHGSLKNERDDIEFAHPHFIRGQESLLELIKRRAPENQQKPNLQGGNTSSSALVLANYLDSTTGRPVELTHLLDDVRNLQNKQTSLSDKLSYMQTENQALWGEIGSLRQKHSKQQQIVSKLMEFLLHFITTNSTHHSEQSVEQQPPNEGLTTDLLHSQQTQSQHQTNNSLNEQGLSPNTLKRKHAALTHTNEPNKRTTMQQHQQQQQPSYGRQQSVTINELTDNDAGGWLHATNTSPLVDLVPSPPPSTQTTDDNHPQQQPQSNDYLWSTTTNEHVNPNEHDQRNLSQQNKTFRTVGNGDNIRNTYVPDFVLRTDNPTKINLNLAQPNGANLTGNKPSHTSPTNQLPIQTLLKEEGIEFPNQFQQNVNQPIDEQKTSPTLYSQNQQQHKIDQPSEQLSFSLGDITGDVDHIQSSLENIRELMFDSLPDGTSIEDLFGEDPELLSPLLKSADNPTGNFFLENLQDQKPFIGDHPSESVESTINSQSVPNINNQLLEQLITESAILEEQRNTINQLAREKTNLEDKIHLLEQQKTQRK